MIPLQVGGKDKSFPPRFVLVTLTYKQTSTDAVVQFIHSIGSRED